MIKGIIAGGIFIVFLVGGYVLYDFYKKMQNSDVEYQLPSARVDTNPTASENIPLMQSTENTDNQNQTENIDTAWIENARQKAKDSTYQFPSNILDIGVDVKQYQDLKMDYTKVVVKNLDDYKFLCLNQILRQNRIDFSYFKKQDSLDLLLLIPDKAKREAILNDFAYYNIDYEIGIKR